MIRIVNNSQAKAHPRQRVGPQPRERLGFPMLC